MKNIILFLSIFLVFGCLLPYSGDVNETGPVKNETKQEPTTNVTAPANVTAPVNVTENQTPAMNDTDQTNGTPEPVKPTYTQTNKTVNELLPDYLDTISAPHGGPYKIVMYQWVSNQLEVDPQAITINPTMHILFDEEAEDNLAGFGFNTYEKDGSLEYAEGFAIVMTKSRILDSKLVGTFDIDFLVPGFETKLYDSQIKSKEELQDSSGRLIIIYGFSSNNVE
jgi:hypothetical protein